jgi:hypothetical protein
VAISGSVLCCRGCCFCKVESARESDDALMLRTAE